MYFQNILQTHRSPHSRRRRRLRRGTEKINCCTAGRSGDAGLSRAPLSPAKTTIFLRKIIMIAKHVQKHDIGQQNDTLSKTKV